MAVTSFRPHMLFLVGFITVAAAAYLSGVMLPYLNDSPASLVALPKPLPSADPKTGSIPSQLPPTTATRDASALVITPDVPLPSFDVVRVDGDGSMLIAGKAAPNAKIEVVAGARVIGRTIAWPDGDFLIILDEPLNSGGYQLALRSTTSDNATRTSLETALVSIPETETGQLLVLIEQPGEASKLVTVPKVASSNSAAEPAEQVKVAASPAPTVLSPASPTAESKVAIEAVEIDGRKIFLAGTAYPGRKVRGYVGNVLLGETITTPAGRFLIEAERSLPVGDYMIHVDMLGLDGLKVVGATVPFERRAGEATAAVAAAAPVALDILQAEPLPSDPATGTVVAAAAERIAPKLQNVESAVIIRRGDTLWQISHRVYGQGVRYSTIYLANEAQISDPDLIWPGQVFTVPENTPEGEPANMKAVGKQATTISIQ